MSTLIEDLAAAAIDREAAGQRRAPILRAFLTAASRLLAEEMGPEHAIAVHATRIRRLHERHAARGVRRASAP